MGRFAEWLWGRYRHRRYSVVVAAMAIVAMDVLFLVPTMVFTGELLDLSAAETWQIGVVAIGTVNVVASLNVASLRRTRAPLDALGRGEPVDAVAAWNAALELPHRYPRRTNLAQAPIQYGITVPLVASWGDLDGWQTACVVVAFVGLQMMAGLVFGVGMRLLLRPALEELVPQLPLDATPVRRDSTLRNRLLLTFWLCCWVMGLIGGLASREADTGPEVFASSFVAAVALSTYILVIVGTGVVRPSLEPVGDLLAATRRVAHGDYDEIVPVTSADELGELAVAFNQMQHGLQQRADLQAAFGSYVDPVLAQRLLDSGSSMFEGEDVELTVLFADVRDFTGFASRIDPADAVAHLNRLFDVIVPVLHEHGGHANHYLGDGLLAIFGAPNPMERHADAALAAAVDLQRRVREEFGKQLRLGVGINTGLVIAGTVGGGGRLEFTVIGDTVNVAARVEQQSKETGDAILLTEATRAALTPPHARLLDRGKVRLRGKDEPVALFAVNPFPRASSKVR